MKRKKAEHQKESLGKSLLIVKGEVYLSVTEMRAGDKKTK